MLPVIRMLTSGARDYKITTNIQFNLTTPAPLRPLARPGSVAFDLDACLLKTIMDRSLEGANEKRFISGDSIIVRPHNRKETHMTRNSITPASVSIGIIGVWARRKGADNVLHEPLRRAWARGSILVGPESISLPNIPITSVSGPHIVNNTLASDVARIEHTRSDGANINSPTFVLVGSVKDACLDATTHTSQHGSVSGSTNVHSMKIKQGEGTGCKGAQLPYYKVLALRFQL